MHVAIASCSELPRPDGDLPVLVAAFAARGARAEILAWDDPMVDWAAYPIVLVRSTWNYVGRAGEFRDWIARVGRSTRIVNPAPLMLWNLHKGYLLELAAAGIPVVPTVLSPAGGDPDWNDLFARFGDLVVKPAVSAGSFGTIRVRHGDASAARAHRASLATRDMLVQPLLASVIAHGETNIVCFGGRASHAIHKGARWSGDLEQSRGLVDPSDDELALAEAVLAHVSPMSGGAPAYARVDCAQGADGRTLLLELEVIEPSLFLDRAPGRAARLVDAVLASGGDA